MKTTKGKDAELERAKAPAEDEEETGEGQEEEGGEEEEGEEEETEKCASAKKSADLTEDDLEKSLGHLQRYIEDGDAPTRKEVLLQKAQREELSKSEQQELFEILGSGSTGDNFTLVDEIEKAMEPSEDLQKALDVSDFLSETHEETKRVFQTVAEHIEKSDSRQHEFNILLAKGVADIGNLVKAMSTRLGVIEERPAHAPKSQVLGLQKSFAGQPVPSNRLSKSEILNTMSVLIEKSCNANMGGVVEGIDLVNAASKYEQFNQIHPTVLALVERERNGAVH